MLPGFRFLFAAIVLSMSILVFGLGAAALLRAAHEQFASTPSWRVAPEPAFAQQNEASREILREVSREPVTPVLAMLRVEPEPAQQKAAASIPAAAAPPEPPAIAPLPDQPEKIAALKAQDAPPPEAAKPEIPAAETSVQREAPAPAEEARIATAEQALPPAHEAVAPASEQAIAAEDGIATTKIATLGGPSVAIEAQPPAKTVAKPDQSVARKRLKARRTAQRRRIAQRAREAAAQQQAADPFAQPTMTTRSR